MLLLLFQLDLLDVALLILFLFALLHFRRLLILLLLFGLGGFCAQHRVKRQRPLRCVRVSAPPALENPVSVPPGNLGAHLRRRRHPGLLPLSPRPPEPPLHLLRQLDPHRPGQPQHLPRLRRCCLASVQQLQDCLGSSNACARQEHRHLSSGAAGVRAEQPRQESGCPGQNCLVGGEGVSAVGHQGDIGEGGGRPEGGGRTGHRGLAVPGELQGVHPTPSC